MLDAAGYGDSIEFESISVVRGLEYYTGPCSRLSCSSPIKDERGQPIRLGSVGERRAL